MKEIKTSLLTDMALALERGEMPKVNGGAMQFIRLTVKG